MNDVNTPRFSGQQEDEVIIYSFCEHMIVLLSKFLKLLFITFVFSIFAYITYLLYVNKTLNKEITKWAFLILLCLYGYFFHTRTAKIFDSIMKIYIVTNMRIVIIDKGIFFKDYKDIIDLRKIQDITSNEVGLLSNLFSYGNIEITLASSSGIRVIKTVPSPHEIVEIIDKTKRTNINIRHEEKVVEEATTETISDKPETDHTNFPPSKAPIPNINSEQNV